MPFWKPCCQQQGFFFNKSNRMNNKLVIFDTTLRDGEQSPGASMTLRQKLEVAQQLARLKVDVIDRARVAVIQGDHSGASCLLIG